MADITLTTTSTLNSGSITIHVYEDVDDDGSGPNSVTLPDGTTLNYDNTDSVTLTGGIDETNTLSGFIRSSGDALYLRIVYGTLTNKTDDSPTLDEWELSS